MAPARMERGNRRLTIYRHAGVVRSLQAELTALRETNQLLSRENTTLKSRNTRLNNQKELVEDSLQKMESALETQFRMTETRTKKMRKAQEQVQLLLDKPCDECENYEELLKAEEERYQELSGHALRLKQKVAASSRVDNQISDETIREAMSCAFVAIKDCFWGAHRKQKFGELRYSDRSGYFLLTKLPEITVDASYCQQDLDRYVPSYKDNTKNDKIHLCILAVALFLVDVVNEQMAFGWPHDKYIQAATICYANVRGKLHKQPVRSLKRYREAKLVHRASEHRNTQEGTTMALAHKRASDRQGSEFHGSCERAAAGLRSG